MGWHGGSFTFGPGVSGTFLYGWGNDHGVQFAEPMQLLSNIGPPIVENTLRTTSFGTIRNQDGLSVTYFLDVTNDGPGTSTFTIIGFGDTQTGA